MPKSSIEVRDLRPDETEAAAGVLARGMRDNPIHVAAYGKDPDRRLQCHTALMRAQFKVFTEQQPICAVRDGVIVGVAGIAPAGTCQPNTMQRLRMFPTLLGLGWRRAARVGRWLDTWTRYDPKETHVHVGPLGVDAHLQGQGIESLLLKEHCRRLDAAGHVGYLETDNPENVRLYKRFAYEVKDEERVIGVPNWFMRRPARTP
ncbi:MAG: GNAT family N-acetyltransferase [Solirubrobacteraceae bacterium]